jgi:hypothetical protein
VTGIGIGVLVNIAGKRLCKGAVPEGMQEQPEEAAR